LRKAGYTVIAAENGLKALEAATTHQEKIGLLFTDVVMPLMDGKTLSEKIKRFCPDIPILFGSGYTDDYLPLGFSNLDGAHFINKPYNLTELLVKIRQLLDQDKVATIV